MNGRRRPGAEGADLCPRFHRAVELIGRRSTGAIVSRTVAPGSTPRVEYALTERGAAMVAPVEALRAWAHAWLPAGEEGEPSGNK